MSPLKITWGSFGHVEIYNKIDYFWNFEYAVFYKMAYLKIIYYYQSKLLVLCKLDQFFIFLIFFFKTLKPKKVGNFLHL
jgi:hypothetical protein